MARASFGKLPPDLLSRASLRRAEDEYAWPLADIPLIIQAAKEADLVSVGGQLQFRPPRATCECYWVEVDTYRDVSQAIPWADRVEQTAVSALAQFQALFERFDFVAEGHEAFATTLTAITDAGQRVEDHMFFVWYLLDADDDDSNSRNS